MALHAPYGNDEQPSLAVKIVGGKSFEVKERNGGRYDSLSRTPYKYSSRPPWFLDDDPVESVKFSKPQLRAITSLTPAFGPRGQAIVDKHRNKEPNVVEVQHDDSPETEAMDIMLSRMLPQYSSSNFKAIYTEMAGYDSRLSGYIPGHQVETTFKRHKVPIPSTMLKMILPRFCSENNADMINYESLIKYLFSFGPQAKPSHVGKPSKGMKLDLNHEIMTNSRHLDSSATAQPYVSPRSLVKRAMDDREEAYLLVQIEQAFKTSGLRILNILESLQNDLSKLSNGTEYIKGDQIERTCSWLRVPLHHTLLRKILNRFDVKKNGKVNWLDFVRFLEKGVPLSIRQKASFTSQKSTGRSPLPFWESRTPLAPVQSSPWKSGLENGGDSANGTNVFRDERNKWDTSKKQNNSTMKPDKKERSYEILKVENFRNDGTSGISSPKSSFCDVIESNNLSEGKPETTAESKNSGETTEDKLEKFSHLTEALLRCDVDDNGTLNVGDVFRIVSNYNLVYNLNFPRDQIQDIIQSSTLVNSDEVIINDVARKLWDLMK